MTNGGSPYESHESPCVWIVHCLQVNGRLKNVCECSISMEKDQSVPIMPFDKPGADPNEEEFEEDEERRLRFLLIALCRPSRLPEFGQLGRSAEAKVEERPTCCRKCTFVNTGACCSFWLLEINRK